MEDLTSTVKEAKKKDLMTECRTALSNWEVTAITLDGNKEKHHITEAEKDLIIELARLQIDFKTAQAIWLLTMGSPNAVEMTTEILRTMKTATKHQALEAMTKAIVLYPTVEMRRLRIEE